MKKLLIVTAVLGLATMARATVTIDFNVGLLKDATGSAVIADGQLIQVVAAPTVGGFVAPTPTAFISGSEILLWSGAFDSLTTGTAGSMNIALAPISIATLPAGYALMVQWFPTLGSGASAPGNSTPYGQYYGQFTPDATTVVNVGSDPTWLSPADGSTVSYNFLTASTGVGGIANSAGYASLATAAVPEPATYAAVFGVLALGLVAWRRRTA